MNKSPLKAFKKTSKNATKKKTNLSFHRQRHFSQQARAQKNPHTIRCQEMSTKPHRYTGPKRSAAEMYKLYPVSAPQPVPDHIRRPDYSNIVAPSIASQSDSNFEIKTSDDIAWMREVCSKASYIREFAGSLVEPGITTDEIDRQVHEEIIRLNCYPSPLHYGGFPKSVAISPNNVICHGIPDQRVLKKGDIVNIDVTLYSQQGYHGDCNGMFIVDKCDSDAADLIDAAWLALNNAIDVCHDGQKLSAIGYEVQKVANEYHYGVCPSFSGHGIGKLFHMDPIILHCANNFPGIMKSGMIFTIEPVLNEHQYPEFVQHDDKWTILTVDGSRSAQFEQTILITQNGAEVLTQHQPGQYS